jgi:hypothetical protein
MPEDNISARRRALLPDVTLAAAAEHEREATRLHALVDAAFQRAARARGQALAAPGPRRRRPPRPRRAGG